MAAPATEHVRNIVLVGQDGAGKTSLAEAMLHVSGRTPRMGTTHDGKSYLDYDQEEIRRKFTLGTSVAPIPYHDYKINLLDTSGHPDFIGDTLATMQAAEMALFVVDAVAGPQVMTTKLWREAEGMRLSRAVFINHIDREHANFDTIMAQLHARFGSRLGPVTIPIGVAEDFKGVIDVLRMKARYFDQDGTTDDRIEDIPAEYAEAANKKEEDKVGTFLTRAVENDPTLRVARNEQTHQTIVTAMGEAQVETLLARMKEQAKVEARLVPVRIPYRETITKTAEAQGRHKKQTGGAGQFGDCWLRISPNPGEGYEFADEVKGGAIPGGLIPAVDKGVQEAMAEGFLAGYPMVDIKCAVFDGSYHSVDSNEMAFKTAARIGFRAACEQAGAILLEPMATMDIVVTEEYAGTVMGDIATRRGRIVGTDSTDEGETVIMVRVPYAEVISYTKDLRAMTRGSGSYYIELEGYDPAPADVTKKLVEAYQASKA